MYFLKKYKVVILLGLIMAVGIFLRTYEFHDWLRFSPDQARDITLIQDVIEGKIALPLSGPQAGNTRFSLGPLYYSFQYVSGLIFGVTPQSMAYPDLFFSLLAIPLLFFFLRKYFATNTTLALTALMSVSYFSVINSRFASNPNSIPFFLLLFLFGLFEMMDKKNKERLLWPTIMAIGLGVGIQQHTLLLLCMPLLALIVAGWLVMKKQLHWKSFILALVIIAFLNTGQIIHEYNTNGGNMRALLGGISNRSSGQSKLLENTGLIASCQLQANAHIISSLQDIETCGSLFKIRREFERNGTTLNGLLRTSMFIGGVILSLIFTLGGYVLGWRLYKREQDERKKNFLLLLAGFNFLMFLIFIPVAGEVSMRYFIVLFYVPLVLLGIWLDTLREMWKKTGVIIGFIIIAFLVVASIFVDVQVGMKLSRGQGNDVKNSYLGETELMASYIISEADPMQSKIYLSGKKLYAKRFFKPLNFLLSQSHKNLYLYDDYRKVLNPGTQVFFAETSRKNHEVGGTLSGHQIKDIRKFGRITIVVLSW